MPHSYASWARRANRNQTRAERKRNRAVKSSNRDNMRQQSNVDDTLTTRARRERNNDNPFTYRQTLKRGHNQRRERNRRQERAEALNRDQHALQYAHGLEEYDGVLEREDRKHYQHDMFDQAKQHNSRGKNARRNRHQERDFSSRKQHYLAHRDDADSKLELSQVQSSVKIPQTADSTKEYDPNITFAQLGVPQPLVDVLAKDGKTTAFPIQQATLGDSLQGKNLLGRGRTGSGKTLAFSIPLVARLARILGPVKRNTRVGRDQVAAPLAMILAPTRELVHQIDDVIQPLAHAYGMRTVCVYGGVRYQRQIAQLRQGAQIILACPGRLEDLLSQGVLTLEQVEISVLDEADEMADMGFLPAVTRLLEQVKQDGQRMLFSATLDKQVASVVERFLPNATVHAVDDVESQVDTMTHHVFAVSQGDKYEVLRKLASGTRRSIFFTRTKFQAKNMAKKFVQQGIPAVDLQGNLSQNQRERHLRVFAQGEVRVLVATDVAARGIDISGVALVVQTEPPEDPKSFLHRSGRTARAGNDGDVVTLVLPNQKRSSRIMLKRAGIHAQAQDITPSSPILDELIGQPAELVEGWSMPEPEVKKTRSSRRRGNYRARSNRLRAERKNS